MASTQKRIDKDGNNNSTTQAEKVVAKRLIEQSDFKVAIICALPLEAEAVCALFDSHLDEDDILLGKTAGDPNVYSRGKIGPHYVVLTHMANVGKANAAAVAAHCSRTFRNIKLALVVGICGAVPFSAGGTDIMLGDVIIGEGVIQYDLGRQFPHEFKHKDEMLDSLSRPIVNIRSALSKWKMDEEKKKLHSSMYKCLSMLQATSELLIQYPGALQDKLFQASYHHVDDGMS